MVQQLRSMMSALIGQLSSLHAHELFLLPLPPKSAVNFFCYSNVQPALRLSCKCCKSSLMVVFTQGQPCKIQFHMICPKIYIYIIVRNWNLTLFWSIFVLWQTAGQTKWLLINPASTNIFCNSRVHLISLDQLAPCMTNSTGDKYCGLQNGRAHGSDFGWHLSWWHSGGLQYRG